MNRIIQGDCRDVMRQLIAEGVRVDAIVTDPPYDLTAARPGGRSEATRGAVMGGFMGLKWDGTGVAFDWRTWEIALELLKLGGHLLAFGGTRTYHRLACAIEDAGFEIRDCIAWVYGSGFPKSLDVSKAIDKAAGAEREVLAHGKPVKRMIPGADQNATGSWIKDNGREYVPTESAPATDAARAWAGWGTALKPAFEPIVVARKPLAGTVAANVLAHGVGAINVDACRVLTDGERREPVTGRGAIPARHDADVPRAPGAVAQPHELGRWPANLVHDGSEEVLQRFPDEAGAAAPVHKRNGDKFRNSYGAFDGNIDEGGSTFHGDTGSAARFFYCAKANASERGQSKHPTVKPIALMQWLVRLVAPRGALILDPFAGSGTTVEACMVEQMRYLAIEQEAEYVADINARIARVRGPLGLELTA